MYAIATAAICYGVRQVGALWYISANVMLIAVQAEWPGAQRFVFAGLLIGVLVTVEWSLRSARCSGRWTWRAWRARRRVSCKGTRCGMSQGRWRHGRLDRHFGLTNQIKFAYTASHGQG